MRNLSLLTWKEIREIDKSKSIVFVVLAPIEEHGWHLPLATDLIEGDCWSKGAMKLVERRTGTGVGVKAPEELENFEKDHANDFHAGWIETSRDMISKKKQISAMGRYGHLGFPRLGDKKLGDMLNKNCIASIVDAVIKFYTRDGYEQYGNYALYKILPLHIGFLPVLGRVNRKKVTK